MNSNTFANPGRQVVQHTLNFSVFFFLCVWSVVSSLISKKIICIHRHSFKLWLDLCSSHFKDMPFRRVHTYIGLVSFLWSVKLQSKRYFFQFYICPLIKVVFDHTFCTMIIFFCTFLYWPWVLFWCVQLLTVRIRMNSIDYSL